MQPFPNLFCILLISSHPPVKAALKQCKRRRRTFYVLRPQHPLCLSQKTKHSTVLFLIPSRQGASLCQGLHTHPSRFRLLLHKLSEFRHTVSCFRLVLQRLQRIHQFMQKFRCLHIFPDVLLHLIDQHPHQRETFVEISLSGLIFGLLTDSSRQDLLHFIIILIFLVQIIISTELFNHPFIADVLPDQGFLHRNLFFLVKFQHLGKILPSPGRNIVLASYRSLYLIEIILFQIQEIHDRRMQSPLLRIFFPGSKVCLHFQYLQPVESHHVEFPHRFIVLRRITGRHNDPSLRYLMPAKHFILQKLQHRRRQRLRHTIDLIQEKNAFPDTALFHHLIDRGDNLTHRIF